MNIRKQNIVQYYFIFLIILIVPSSSKAAFDLLSYTARSNSTGVSLIAESHNISGLDINPASGNKIDGFIISTSFAQRFSLKELESFQLDAALPVGRSVIGFNLSGFGKGKYEERTVGFSYSHPLVSTLQLGVGLKYSRLQIQNYDSDNAILLSFGILYNHHLGNLAFCVNKISTGFDKYDQVIEPRYIFAVSRNIFNKINIHLELLFDNYSDGQPAMGIEYAILENLKVTSGYNNSNKRFYAGFNLNWNRFQAILGQDYHPDLGWSRAQGFVCRYAKP